MFTDEVEINVESGRGGDGMVHFRREKYVPKGGPDGGDGGRGGDVVLRVSPTLSTLSSIRQNQRFAAPPGGSGGPAQRTGKDGKDVVIQVPPGTMVFEASSGQLLADLAQNEDGLVLCRGGRGGRGNQHFATSRNQAPRTAERGEPAEQKRVRLELRLIADIGIVGLPNAGKSTLLAALTNARPKIAAYPFTTLEPVLGVATLDGGKGLVLADIPGLIEGAHAGAGLGHDFLRHIQRTRLLIHVLDGLSEDPLADYSQVNAELALFDAKITEKPQLIVLNKIDQPEVVGRLSSVGPPSERVFQCYRSRRSHARPGDLLAATARCATAPVAELNEAVAPVYRPSTAQDFLISRTGGHEWRVSGAAIERSAAMTFWQHDGSLRRFQRLLERVGIDAALRQAGVQEGDSVAIGEFELEWRD
jgi:GTP-binding protein